MCLSLSNLSVPGLRPEPETLQRRSDGRHPQALRLAAVPDRICRLSTEKSMSAKLWSAGLREAMRSPQLRKSRSGTKNSSSRSRQRPETHCCGPSWPNQAFSSPSTDPCISGSWLFECQAESLRRGGCEVAGILRTVCKGLCGRGLTILNSGGRISADRAPTFDTKEACRFAASDWDAQRKSLPGPLPTLLGRSDAMHQ